MGIVVQQYPIRPTDDPLIAGDDVNLYFRIREGGVDQDISGRTFQAKARIQPGAEELFEFECIADPGTTGRLILHAGPTVSVHMVNGFQFDIQELDPVVRTWFSTLFTRVRAQVTYDD